MSSFTAEQRVLAAIEQARSQILEALTSAEEGGNAFSLLGEELRVDQARRIVVDAAGTPDNWTLRDGKRSLTTARLVDRGMLSLFVGGNRFLPTEAVFFFLTDITSGKGLRNAGNFPTFLNVFVVEGMLYPEHELAIWVTAARLLQMGRDEDLHAVLPPLNTDFDIFHAELPAAEEPSHKLRPAREERTGWPTYKMRLLSEVLPDVAAEAAQPESDMARDAFFRSKEQRLREYVREQLFARVAQAVEASNGRYVLHSPFEAEASK